MKKVLPVLFLLAAVQTAQAQEQTLLDRGIESGGFGGPVVKFSAIGDDFAVFAGGRGGWIVNHTLVIGAGGYGLANDIGEFPFNRMVEFGYGGLELEYINRSNELVHFTLYTLIGGGGVSQLFDPDDTVFVFEPAANVNLNVTTFFRIGLGGGYRFVTGTDTGLDGGELSAPVGMVTLKFGSF